MREYFTNINVSGPVRHGELPNMIGVVESPESLDPIGTAALIGPTEKGLAEWSLRIRGANIPGHWVIIGNWFVPDEAGDHAPGAPMFQ
jgi:hypothetical protein